MTSSGYRGLLTAHVVASVGWLGAVATFLALAVTGLESTEGQRVQAVYVAMQTIAWDVLVPLSFASLLTGLVQSLAGRWGLVRHYWVVFKLAITLVSTALLLVHVRVVDAAASSAASGAIDCNESSALRTQLVVDAGLGLAALLVTVTLSVFKPRGLTRWVAATVAGPSAASGGEITRPPQ